MDDSMGNIFIDKASLKDNTPMLYLYYLCLNAANGHYSRERMQKIIAQRRLALEDALRIEKKIPQGSRDESMIEYYLETIEILDSVEIK